MVAVRILEFVSTLYLSLSNFIQLMNFSVVNALFDLWKAAFRVNRARTRFRANDLLVGPGASKFFAPRIHPISANESLTVIVSVTRGVRLSIRTCAGAPVYARPHGLRVDHILVY